MRILVLFGTLALLCTGTALGNAKSSSHPLDGKWLVAHRGYTPTDGNAEVSGLINDLGTTLVFRNHSITGDSGKSVKVHFKTGSLTLAIKSSKVPKLHGIYRLDGDLLTIALGLDGSTPGNFAISDTTMVLVLKRAAN